MVNRCRHESFANFFGDKKPECIDKCDVCLNKESVKMDLEMFMYGINNQSNISMSNEEITPNEFYGGGRNAITEYNF